MRVKIGTIRITAVTPKGRVFVEKFFEHYASLLLGFGENLINLLVFCQ